VISARPAGPLSRSMTKILLAVLLITPLISCAEQSEPPPPVTVSSGTVSPDCLNAMRDKLDGALYKPETAAVSRLPECESESEQAIGAAAEQLLREAFDTPARSPSPTPPFE
jgi:hypothetical protein